LNSKKKINLILIFPNLSSLTFSGNILKDFSIFRKYIHKWWKTLINYQIYLESFMKSLMKLLGLSFVLCRNKKYSKKRIKFEKFFNTIDDCRLKIYLRPFRWWFIVKNEDEKWQICSVKIDFKWWKWNSNISLHRSSIKYFFVF
jgi:hypothetical protein